MENLEWKELKDSEKWTRIGFINRTNSIDEYDTGLQVVIERYLNFVFW